MTEETKESYRLPYNATFCVIKFHADQWYCDAIPLRRAKDYSKASEVDAQLFSAADVGDVKLIQQMVERGANVNFQHCAGTPLTRAARRGHLSCAQILLDHGADVNMGGNFNCQTCTALHAAASNGHYEVVQLLLDRGADVHAERDQKSTALHDAAKFGHPDVAELLLQHGAQVNAQNSRSKTPLYLAASEGKLDALRWVLEAVIEYYHYQGYHYNNDFFPQEAVVYLLNNQKKVNALDMSDLQDLRTFLLKNDLVTIKLIIESRPAGNVKQRQMQLLKVLFEAGCNTEILHEYDTGALEEALHNRDDEIVSFLVKHGAIINRAGTLYGWKGTPMHFAIVRSTESILKILLNNGGDANIQDWEGKTPLHLAAREKLSEHVQLLLNYGARIDILDNNGGNPLHDVKSVDCARLLVERGADVTAITKCGRSVLFEASDRCGEGECVQFLIDQGADPLKEDENGITALDLAVSRWHCESSYDQDDGGLGAVKVLMQHGAKLKEVDFPLINAIKQRKTGRALALLRSGSDVNAIGEDGMTALSFAAKYHFTAGVEMLLEEGADPNIQCSSTSSPLHIALMNGSEGIAKLLLQAGAIPNPDIYNTVKSICTYTNILKLLCNLQWQDSDGNSLMHVKCYILESIVDLVEAEADTNVADKRGITPLHIVCYKGSKPHVKLLLENKADPNKRDVSGLTPLHFAAFRGHTEVGRLLLENGTDAKAQDAKGQTPAHVAAQCGSTSYLKQLLSHGADINVQDKLGWTPLHQAERNGCTECVDVLIKHGADRTVPKPDHYSQCEIPTHMFNIISKYENFHPEPEEEDEDELGFGLFD